MATEDESDRTITRLPTASPARAPSVGHFLSFTEAGRQRRLPIGPEGVIIGRTVPAQLVIAAPDVSRRHCRVELNDDWAVVSDLNSTNGTFVDGERLTAPRRLRNGNVLALGSFQIQYERRDPRAVAEEEALAADLRRAVDYVRAILPPPLADGPVRADWCFVPSAQLGGDAFGYQFLPDGECAGFLLDVSGHGIGSAMHAVNVANVLRRRALPEVDFRDPGQVASGLNSVFPMEEHNDLMLTLWYFVFDPASRVLRYCSGGHHPAYLLTPGVAEPVALSARGPAIGMLPFGRWNNTSVTVPPGARLCVFSDGAFEIVDAAGREWDIENFRRLLAGPTPPSPGDLWQAVSGATGGRPLDDDFSVVVLDFP